MAYYDVHDENDNLIASNVWIDENDPGRPIVINWYKVFIMLLLVIGIISTFVTPVILFTKRDSFINNGWIYMSLFNIVMGLPVFISSLNMLMILKKENKQEDDYYSVACSWVKEHCKFLEEYESIDDEMSDKQYVENKKRKNKYQATISAVYVAIKFQKLLTNLSKISYIIYPLTFISFLIELFIGQEDVFFISLLNFNFIAFFCGLFSAYKNYKSYQKNGIESPKGRMIKTILISFLLSVPVGALIFSLMNSDGFYILVFCIMVMDLMMIIDNKLITKNNIRIINNKKTIHLGVLLVTTICSSLLMLLVASAVPLLPGPISDAIIAFDEGRSTDLTLPIIFWSICLVVNILVIVVVSKTISNKLNKN